MNKEKFITPVCEARFPFLNHPDTKFDPEGIFRIELLLDSKNPEHKKFLADIHALFVQSKGKNMPYKKDVNKETKEETGLWSVKFTSAYRPRTFDAKKNPLDENTLVGNGSKVRVSYGYSFYEGMNGGVKLYLQAVQVLDLVEWNGGTADDYGFQEEQGFVASDPASAIQEFVDAFQGTPVPKDDLPF